MSRLDHSDRLAGCSALAAPGSASDPFESSATRAVPDERSDKTAMSSAEPHRPRTDCAGYMVAVE